MQTFCEKYFTALYIQEWWLLHCTFRCVEILFSIIISHFYAQEKTLLSIINHWRSKSLDFHSRRSDSFRFYHKSKCWGTQQITWYLPEKGHKKDKASYNNSKFEMI